MKADWVLEIEIRNFFEKKKELRMRVTADSGPLKDRILFGVFEKTLLEEFTAKEIAQAVKAGYLVSEKIVVNGSLRNAYGWTEQPCQFQPNWFKRNVQKYLSWTGLV